MIPRFCAVLAAVALASGSLIAAAGSADAATTARPGITHLRPGGAVHTFVPGGVMHTGTGPGSTGALAHERAASNQAQSTNWSGYAATGAAGSFNSVSSSWTQPTATCSSGDQYAAFWVGLDGYNSGSVEQTGTDSDCSGGNPDYYGWYEMYPNAPVYYSNPVSPGDSMSASVSVSGDTYTLVLTDSTQNWTQTQTITESWLQDSSAEVITEAPSSSSGVLPLADFGTVNYTGSSVNGSSMASSSPTGIIMVGSSGDQLDSTSPMDSSGDFSNTWMASS